MAVLPATPHQHVGLQTACRVHCKVQHSARRSSNAGGRCPHSAPAVRTRPTPVSYLRCHESRRGGAATPQGPRAPTMLFCGDYPGHGLQQRRLCRPGSVTLSASGEQRLWRRIALNEESNAVLWRKVRGLCHARLCRARRESLADPVGQ
jgi:hypothetical protein